MVAYFTRRVFVLLLCLSWFLSSHCMSCRHAASHSSIWRDRGAADTASPGRCSDFAPDRSRLRVRLARELWDRARTTDHRRGSLAQS
jgi:hypothetical protein